MGILITVINSLVDIYTFLIFVYVLMSWFPIRGGIVADINRVRAQICDPYLNLFRRFIPPIGGMIDISPIIALLVLQFGVRLLLTILLWVF